MAKQATATNADIPAQTLKDRFNLTRPPRYLKDGDIVELEIEGLGRKRQTVVKG